MALHQRSSMRHSSYGAHRPGSSTPSAAKVHRPSMNSEDTSSQHPGPVPHDESDITLADDDPRHQEFRERFAKTEQRIAALLSGTFDLPAFAGLADGDASANTASADRAEPQSQPAPAPKKPARTIDEDDYGDDDDDDDEADEPPQAESPLQTKSAAATNASSSLLKVPSSLPAKSSIDRAASTSSADQSKNAEDVRKELNEQKKAAEDAARRSSHRLFYTLETDRDAMLEQQKLDDLDRQVETEMSGQSAQAVNNAAAASANQQGSLSSANLGSSSLTFKHLISRIDAKRNLVRASDAQLRSLMSDVRKNRSKWASEDKVGQEELYEAAEKVLMELKAMTEHAAPFLQRVNKRDAPDYYQVIKQPMDIGTMIKKLKSLQYRSKKEFVDDLNLIWSNCLKYNADPSHFLRKKALYMKKETDKLVPLIPDIVVRDRAEVEAEERRMQSIDADLEGVEDSDDEPIMASRGRKAPSKGNKGSAAVRKAPSAGTEGTPGAETKPMPGSASIPRTEFLRADSEMDGGQNGFQTPPPPGTLTPLGTNGIPGTASQADASDIDAGSSVVGAAPTEDADLDDAEYKTWKQVTKKDRAMIAAERHRLFRNDHLNVEEPALIRTKAGMRRWLRQHKQAIHGGVPEDEIEVVDGKDGVQEASGETLAEGIEGEEERQVPDYYDTLSVMPELNERLKWAEDSEGQVIQQGEEFMRMVPKGYFQSPKSNLATKMEANMRQMQDTRKICAKIGIVKQMQLQSQTYQNQFQKYDPQPFEEADAGPVVVSDDGAVMSQWTCRAALQRSVAKVFYHAGFEEFQPSALDSVTDIASNFFTQLARTFNVYREAPKVRSETGPPMWKPRFTSEETILHALRQNGVDLEALDSYVKEDVERLGSKLGVMHERMKAHLNELLRPALDFNAGADGAGAFNDGSEQFSSGDFADEIGEDFFGFRELGLDKELASFTVPFHLLQNRIHNAYQAQNASTTSTAGNLWENPAPWEPVTIHTVRNQIGLVQGYFLEKLHANNDQPLVEDEDLPAKQRFPKPRLPPTGKISSPRKRPLREQQQMAKKKRKLEESQGTGNTQDSSQQQSSQGGANGTSTAGSGAVKGIAKPVGKLKLEAPSSKENVAEPEKDDANGVVGMMSPESINGAG
ncbi:Transcriptional activator spt7 [Lasiodiplodia theobromae]|uniref:SAGA complex subunit Spt7 n=1 Tax=Lasiodiplodia theobromae TaxID=45133 RepID=A0A5N5D698_9PEZI|nr:Transcriptional activator spt7 [Lasiodiplodia theobromae]